MTLFDAKMKTYVQRKQYQVFLKELKGLGYQMLQKSVYYRIREDAAAAVSEYNRIRKIVPGSVEVRIVVLAQKMFEQMLSINCERIDIESSKIICI